VAAAAGLAAGTGAAQLGLGYGLGVVIWPVTEAANDSVWLGSLGWATWITASATVFGAVIASRLRSDRSASSRPGGPWRFALAAAAAVGAVLTVALIAIPARAAVRSDTFSPQTIAAGYAVVGILFGLVIAYWAVASRPVAANLIATAAWLWALAIAAIVVELIWHRSSVTYLTSWLFAGPGTRYGAIYWPDSLLTLLAALVIGIVAAWPAVRRGDLGLGAATSGAVGPLLVAATFFMLTPQLTGLSGSLESAYLIAPYAVLAGLAGSALTVAIGKWAAERGARRAAQASQRTERSGRSGRPRWASRGRPATPPEAAAAPATNTPAGTVTNAPAGPAAHTPTGNARARAHSRAAAPAPGAPVGAQEPVSPAKRASALGSTSSQAPAGADPGTGNPAATNPGTRKPSASKPSASRSGTKADDAPRAGAAAPNTRQTRSTVAPPPASPPVVKINPSSSTRAASPASGSAAARSPAAGSPASGSAATGTPATASPAVKKATAKGPRNPRPDNDAPNRDSSD
jgi:hypothetical protein